MAPKRKEDDAIARFKAAKMKRQGFSLQQIANKIGRSKTWVYDNLNRKEYKQPSVTKTIILPPEHYLR
jgi:transposase